MTRLVTTLTLILCCALAVPSAWAQVLYGADGAQGNPSNLYILDHTNGAVLSTVGPIGFAVTGLAFHPFTGVLYGSTGRVSPVSPGSLITIDKLTGLGTLVGSFGVPNHTMADIAFGPDGTLYGWAEPGRDTLHTIDLATGQATQVGESGIGTAGSGLAATAEAFFLAGDGASGVLYSINRTTGRATTVKFLTPATPGAVSAFARATLDGPPAQVPALTFGPGALLFAPALSGPSASLITINPTTGEVTVLGPTVDRLDALAFEATVFPVFAPAVPVPTLSQAAFVAMAGLLVAVALHQVRRRRLRTSRG